MRFVRELKGFGDESIIAALTGNGRTEVWILKSLAQKYDGGRKTLFFPKFPVHPRPGSGPKALMAVKHMQPAIKLRALFSLLTRNILIKKTLAR